MVAETLKMENETSPGWFTFERRNWLALICVSALLGYSAGNGHTTHDAISHISDQLGSAKQSEGCEHKRAEKAIVVAKQTIRAANTEDAAIADMKALPLKDCPH
jgi:enamine deaminase RidA (YjgF/YER057c/UK114 family)